MNTRKSLLTLALCAAVLSTVLNILSTHAVHADGLEELRWQVNVTTPVSLAGGQTLRVNFFNAGRNPFELTPCFFDGDGLHLKMGEELSLAPGQTRSFDLSRAEAGRLTEPSVEARAGVHAEPPDLQYLVVSGEVMEDATGKSSLFVPGAANQSDPREPGDAGEVTRSLPPVGITNGQTLRVSFFNAGRSPFELTPCFFDGDGAHLKMGDTFTLAPGQTRSFEMSRAEAGMRDTARLLVRGAAHVHNPDAPHLIVTGEVVEDLTGKSSLYVLTGVPAGFNPQSETSETR